ncbi:hypothetical protein [Planosporangium mesophilum]|uniref:FAD:protein FMN transferase n=1 Tax=Planosporangium mesophilum TaxID=689768 RepID=A0A8J3TJR0_9ACTN|nr:hypothetical protein [Planosporangium mesophilum]GII26457.1 hypothetical protein Pme01_60540 [Planosporangium mesophilum]
MFAELRTVDALFSPYRADSLVSAFNRGEPVHEPLFETVADLCEQSRDRTGGYFDAYLPGAGGKTRFDPSGLVKGWGSDLALQTADAVVVRDELPTLPAVIALSRRARRLVVANLVIAATFISVLVAWDLFGHLPLPLGVAGHEGSTVIVGLNGLRLLRARAWRTGTVNE